MRKPLLKRAQIITLSRLLDMQYRPAEIATEIGVTPDTVYRSYLPAGAPFSRDERDNIWIHGLTFAAWARQTVARKKVKRFGLPDGQAWCLKCKHPVPLQNPTPRIVNRYLELLQAPCPTCGTTVNRARARLISPPDSGGVGEGL